MWLDQVGLTIVRVFYLSESRTAGLLSGNKLDFRHNGKEDQLMIVFDI
jgi:hypothetical protein